MVPYNISNDNSEQMVKLSQNWFGLNKNLVGQSFF